MSRKYKNSPIEEAVVEFTFVPGEEWDPTLAGKLLQIPELSCLYNGKPRTHRILNASISSKQGKTSNVSVGQSPERIQLIDASGSKMLSVSENLIAINALRPYEEWECLVMRIRSAIEAYNNFQKPKAVSRIGLRYINKITHPSMENIQNLDQFFFCAPRSPEKLPPCTGSFMNRMEFRYDECTRLLLTLAGVASNEVTRAIILDLDLIWNGEIAFDLEKTMELVENLHNIEGGVFENVITDRSREIFDGSI